MQVQQSDKLAHKTKVKESLSEHQITEKINQAVCKIKNNTEVLRRFIHDLDPHLSRDFQVALKSINYQYSCLINYNVTIEDRLNLRTSIANELISGGTVEVLVHILPQLLHGISDLNCTRQINEVLFGSIKKVMTVFFNYSDASQKFGEEVCKKDRLLSLYHKILVHTEESCVTNSISEDFAEILRITIATLYNTLLYDSENNLQKIRQMNYLDIIKNFLDCEIERIKISSLLFTAYVAKEGDSLLFKSDKESINYLLNLLSESMRMKSCRAKGLSTEELAKGIEKLSKNDDNKQMLVDLGILPIIKKLIEKNSIRYKEISLSILWSLAFDERNRKIIKETFSSILDDTKAFLTNPEEEIVTQDDFIDEEANVKDVDYNFDEDFTTEYLRPAQDYKMDNYRCRKMIIGVEDDENKNEEVSDRFTPQSKVQLSVNTALNKSKCSKILDGLSWTLEGSHKSKVSDESHIQEPLMSKSIKDGHIMISYCWANKEIVMKVYDALHDLGYKLWIDKYNMAENENMMESMANAVENSKALILCISNAYKESQNCRAEAQYAVAKKKPIIPIIVQEKYRPDGWLGFCITGLMYCDFKGSHKFEESLDGLSKQLKRVTNMNQNEDLDTTDHVTSTIISKEKGDPETTSGVSHWSHLEVMHWFQRIGLKKVTWMDHYSGQELQFFKMLSEKSLETFFLLSKDSLDLTDIRDLRIFFEQIQKV